MKHFFKISQTEEFLNLPENQLVQYLKDDHLFVEREEHVFDAVYRWLKVIPPLLLPPPSQKSCGG